MEPFEFFRRQVLLCVKWQLYCTGVYIYFQNEIFYHQWDSTVAKLVTLLKPGIILILFNYVYIYIGRFYPFIGHEGP